MKEHKFIYFIGLLLLILSIQSCGINSNLMLKANKDYVYDELDIDSSNQTKNEYIIGVDDVLQFQFYTNKGIKVLDLASGAGGGGNGSAQTNVSNILRYVVGSDSLIKLPYLDKLNMVGMTIRDAESYLEGLYSGYYVEPFVQITVINKRVIVFPGNGGDAQVVYLTNNNTTLMEAIALAGGIVERGKASKVKLYRQEDGRRKVYLIDLSTIEGLIYTDLVVQNGDYIYVEPVPQVAREVLKEIGPVLSVISSTASIIITVLYLGSLIQ